MAVVLAFLLVGSAFGAAQTAEPPQASPHISGYDAGSRPLYGPPAPSQPKASQKDGPQDCKPADRAEVVVCAQPRQAFRIDPDVSTASRHGHDNVPAASTAVPAAQSSCASSPRGCGTGLESLDLVNVALVVGTAALRAAKGDDWKKAFKTGGPDEYQLYLQVKREREARERAKATVARPHKK